MRSHNVERSLLTSVTNMRLSRRDVLVRSAQLAGGATLAAAVMRTGMARLSAIHARERHRERSCRSRSPGDHNRHHRHRFRRAPATIRRRPLPRHRDQQDDQ